MATSIEWTATINADGTVTPGETWNPTVGCDRISPGCANCYAKVLHDKRHKAVLGGKHLAAQYQQPFETLQLMDDRIDAPLHWRRPRKVFVNSVSDLFHKDVPDAFIDRVFAVMALAPQHTFQILTKRAERMRDYVNHAGDTGLVGVSHAWANHRPMPNQKLTWPLPNVWLGVSVENQRMADERIPLLLQTPAAVRFISAEPLLGRVDLSRWLVQSCCGNVTDGDYENGEPPQCCGDPLGALDWIIAGGESGPHARPCALEWLEAIVSQCRAARVPVFVKQLGAYVVSEARTAPADHFSDPHSPLLLRSPNGECWAWRARLTDRKGGDIEEFPEALRVREFPREVAHAAR